MKKTLKRITAARMTERMVRADAIRERLDWAAAHGEEEILRKYGTPRRRADRGAGGAVPGEGMGPTF